MGLRLMNQTEGLTRSQRWSGFVPADTGASPQSRMKGGFVSAEEWKKSDYREEERRGEDEMEQENPMEN